MQTKEFFPSPLGEVLKFPMWNCCFHIHLTKPHKDSLFLKPLWVYTTSHTDYLELSMPVHVTNTLVQWTAAGRYLHHTAPPLHFSVISRQGLEEPFCSVPCRCPLLLSMQGPCSHVYIGASSTTMPTQHWLFLGGKTSCRHWSLLGPRPHGYQLSL